MLAQNSECLYDLFSLYWRPTCIYLEENHNKCRRHLMSILFLHKRSRWGTDSEREKFECAAKSVLGDPSFSQCCSYFRKPQKFKWLQRALFPVGRMYSSRLQMNETNIYLKIFWKEADFFFFFWTVSIYKFLENPFSIMSGFILSKIASALKASQNVIN